MKLIDDEEESEKSFRFVTNHNTTHTNDVKETGADEEGSIKILLSQKNQKNELDVSLRIADVLGLDEESSIESSLGSSYQEPLLDSFQTPLNLDDCGDRSEAGLRSRTENGSLSSQLWEASSTESSLLSEEELLEDSESDSLNDDDEDDFEASLMSAGFFKRFNPADPGQLAKITEHSRESFRSQRSEDPSYHLKSPSRSSKQPPRFRFTTSCSNSPIKSPRTPGGSSRPRASSDRMDNTILEISFVSPSAKSEGVEDPSKKSGAA